MVIGAKASNPALTLICLLKTITSGTHDGGEVKGADKMSAQVIHYKSIDYAAELKKAADMRPVPDFAGDLYEPNTSAKLASFVVEGRFLRKYIRGLSRLCCSSDLHRAARRDPNGVQLWDQKGRRPRTTRDNPLDDR